MSIIFLVLFIYSVSSQRCVYKKTGEAGSCKSLTDCLRLVDDLNRGIEPTQICGVENDDIIYCCPKEESIGEKKCREYGKRLGNPLSVDRNVGLYIKGGKDAPIGAYPHMAALGFVDDDGNVHYQCGGSVISERFVITAGHCAYAAKFKTFVTHVRLGVNNLDETSFRQDFLVERIIRHPDYKPPATYNDLALILLDKPIKFSPRVKPICLNAEATPKTAHVIATGWGLLQFAGEQSRVLQEVELQLFPFETCRKRYGKDPRRFKHGILDSKQVCIGSFAEKDTCQGDSGGPVQFFDYSKRSYRLVGITSFGKGCGIAGHPSVYTRISNYIEWIESVAWSGNIL